MRQRMSPLQPHAATYEDLLRSEHPGEILQGALHDVHECVGLGIQLIRTAGRSNKHEHLTPSKQWQDRYPYEHASNNDGNTRFSFVLCFIEYNSENSCHPFPALLKG